MSSLSPEQNQIQNPLQGRAGWDRAEYGDGQFDTGFFGAGQPAWHGLGTVIDADVVTAAEAIELAGLNWDVKLVPTYATFGTQVGGINDGLPAFKVIENKWGVQRSTDGSVLGIVSERYQPVQNHEAFQFIDSLVDDGAAKYHTAGSLSNGKLIWLLAKFGDDIVIKGLEDEAIKPFLLLGNSHDGSKALTVSITPIRVVCKNTLNLALKGAQRQWKAKHVKGSLDAFNEAKKTLGLTHKYLQEFELQANNLIDTKVSEGQVEGLLSHLYPLAEDASPVSITRAQNNRADILSLYKNAPNLQNVTGTAWALLNAVGEYNDHGSTVRLTKGWNESEARMRKALDTGLRDKALDWIQDQVLVTA